ncbi:MAG: YhbY family RNA-binding protein, partial [Opitutales bacterium]|nr:YhbY family RNA-binding protein [Opitutales bacterium]
MDENADSTLALSGAEKKKLRGQAQLLEAKISVGKNGVTPEMLKTLNIIFKK